MIHRNSSAMSTGNNILVVVRYYLFTVVALLLFVPHPTSSSSNIFHTITKHIPYIKKLQQKQQYTPLLFFTVPKGMSVICDEMDKVLCQIEQECPNIHVQRLDVIRQPEAEAVLNMVTKSIMTSSSSSSTTSSSDNNQPIIQSQPPLLYHRESRQVYQVVLPSSSSSSKATTTSTQQQSIYIDKERIRAWAKGRYLSPSIGRYNIYQRRMELNNNKNNNNQQQQQRIIVTEQQEQDDLDPVNALIEEMALSPEQIKGKRLMEERTATKNKNR